MTSTKQTIFLDIGTHYSTNPDGLDRYTRQLSSQFEQSPSLSFNLYKVQRHGSKFHILNFIESAEPGLDLSDVASPGDFLLMPCLDTVVTEAFDYLMGLRDAGVKIGVLIPDLIGISQPEMFPKGVSEHLEIYFSNLSTLANFVVTPSQVVANNLQEFQIRLGLTFPTIYVGYPGSDHFENNAETETKLKRLVYISTIEPRKRHIDFIKAFNQSNLANAGWDVSIIGKMGWLTPDDRKIFLSLTENSKGISYFPNASDQFIEMELGRSSGLVMLSTDEGYGLPLMEAAAFNIPLFCVDTPIFKEVTAGFAFFTPNDLSRLSQDLKKWVHSLETQEKVIVPSEINENRTWLKLYSVWRGAIDEFKTNI